MTYRCLPHRAAAVLAVVCAAATPLWAAAPPPEQPPEWLLAESPGAAGFGFGLGIDLSWEDLDRLANTAATTTVTTHDANGGTVTQVIPGDPALNNRKFDYRFEVKTGGGQAPVALPRFSLGRGVTIYPSLVFEAAVTDVTFHFDDRRNPQDSTSVTARGASYGLGLEAVATLGRSNRWFLATGYRFRELPSLDLERSPPFDPFAAPGQGSPGAVTHDRVRLDQETHLATLRVGRAFRDGRFNPYLGLRGRWTDLEFEDELDFRSPLGDETALTTRSRYESDSALAVAGVDAKLGGPFLGRAELTFGDGDAALLLKTVVRLKPKTPNGPGAAEGIAEAFDRLRRELTREAKELEPLRATQPELYVVKVLELLDRLEAEGVAVLTRYDYLALADWLRDRFDEARAAVGAAPASEAAARDPWPPPVARPAVRLASLGGPAPPAPGDEADENGKGEAWYVRAFRALSLIFIRAEEDCLSVRLRFVLDPTRPDVTVILYPKSAPGTAQRWSPNEEVEPKIGSYTYCIEQKDGFARRKGEAPCGAPTGSPRLLFQCLGSERPPGPDADCPLDLAEQPVTRVQCRVADRSCTRENPDPRCAAVDD